MLLLFDIDGTLLHTNGLSKDLFCQALGETFGVEISWSYAHYHGEPDRHLARDLLRRAGIDEKTALKLLPQAFARVGQLWDEQGHTADMVVYPGIRHLLERLSIKEQVMMGQVTANARSAAVGKLRAAKLDSTLFKIGAYGDEADKRADLPPLAMSRAAGLRGHPFSTAEVVIIGDSPADILCAQANGLRSVAVATGRHSTAALASYNPDALLPDLADHHLAFQAFGLF